jgi:methionyl-tRNA formyltransferase
MSHTTLQPHPPPTTPLTVVVLTNDQPNQMALSNKLAAHCHLAAIVVSLNQRRREPGFVERLELLASRISVRLLGRPLLRAWRALQDSYARRFPGLPRTQIVRVRNVNDPETLDVIRTRKPDLVMVSGTNLVSRRTIAASPPGTRWINLHTGISPYMNGGPNCTNWCLAERRFGEIGNTVMWLEPGIDSGAIIATERTPLTGRETLPELHWKVMEHAHDLACRVVRRLAAGEELPSIVQADVASGRTFFNREWHGLAARRAVVNFRRHFPSFFAGAASPDDAGSPLKLFPLDSQ